VKPLDHKIIIVGSGFGGITLGHYLKDAGIDDFIILEKASGLGGTWRENTYPGAECDISSALYSFSFAPNPTWDFKWARQPQILSYMQKTSAYLGITAHMQFNETVKSAVYDETNKRWTVTTEKRVYRCQFFVPALGQLHEPNTPNFKGKDSFKGASFHSAQWDHSVDLTGKRVGVIGNAASAIQFIPEIAKVAGQVDIYQRTPNWIVPKVDRPANGFDRVLRKIAPWWPKFRRAQLWCMGEYVVWPTIKGAKFQSAMMRALFRYNLKKSIKDSKMRETLTPDYPIGAKRILLSDHYYPALARDNVDLLPQALTGGVGEITQMGIVDAKTVSREYDVIIYSTGFHTNPFLKSLDIKGVDGRSIRDHWNDGAFAYLGISTHGFPNMAMLYGPNTNTGHTSIIYKLECQARYIVQMIKAAGNGALNVKETVETEFNQEVQRRLRALAWDKVAASWYKDGDKLPNNWMGSSKEYKKRTERFDPAAYTSV